MRKIRNIALMLMASVHAVTGQTPVGSWSDHLSYNSASGVAVSPGNVFVSTGLSLLVYDKEFAELKKMSTVNGLSETGISSLAWSDKTGALVIGYSNTNTDLVVNNTVYNIPDILNKYIEGVKEINRIRTNGNYAFLACSFGIVVIDIARKEIRDTWKPGPDSENNGVADLCFGNDNIYAATEKGVFMAGLSDQGLSYFGNWDRINSLPQPEGAYNGLVFSGGRVYANRHDPLASGDSIYVLEQSPTLFSYIPGLINITMDEGTAGFTVSSGTMARYFDTGGMLKETVSSYGSVVPGISESVADNGILWIADIRSGFIKYEGSSRITMLRLPGPVSNNSFNISSVNGTTVICGGGTDNSWNNLDRPLQVSLFRDNGWTIIPGGNIRDAMRSLIDPANSDHFFVSTWGGGLLEFNGGNLSKQYNDANSPLQSAIPGEQYVRICGMAMDREKNLWITQSGVPGPVKILKPDGSWIVSPLTIDAPVAGDIIITKSGYKWIILPEGHGLFILDDNNTPGVPGDDRTRHLIVKDTGNEVIGSVYSIAEDLDGNIWAGTDQGPLVYYSPETVFNDDLRASRIKVPRKDGSGLSDYLLRYETVSSIAVDGSNRKWLGTTGSGAWYVSPDGTSLLKNFSVRNSPILSDSVASIAIDNKTGDIWFGTSKGLQSYRGNATAGGEKFNNVYAFPNPVREDFTGNVTITGLIRDTQINITDISGNLVFKTFSDGGEATWDLKTYNGKHVATGVYLIFCASSDGSQALVTKILVIR